MTTEEPVFKARLSASQVKQFEARLDKSSCWLWTGAVGKHGYGNLTIDQRSYRAHRLAYELWVGAIPVGLLVRHSCDNRRCCNPAHLELGTNKQNTADALERGRFCRGARHHSFKVTPEIEGQFRALSAAGFTQQAIADRFGVAPATVWRHL